MTVKELMDILDKVDDKENVVIKIIDEGDIYDNDIDSVRLNTVISNEEGYEDRVTIHFNS